MSVTFVLTIVMLVGMGFVFVIIAFLNARNEQERLICEEIDSLRRQYADASDRLQIAGKRLDRQMELRSQGFSADVESAREHFQRARETWAALGQQLTPAIDAALRAGIDPGMPTRG